MFDANFGAASVSSTIKLKFPELGEICVPKVLYLFLLGRASWNFQRNYNSSTTNAIYKNRARLSVQIWQLHRMVPNLNCIWMSDRL